MTWGTARGPSWGTRVSRWINRCIWTGNDRPMCAEVFWCTVDDKRSKRSKKCWRVVEALIDLLAKEEDHCYCSWNRWPN